MEGEPANPGCPRKWSLKQKTEHFNYWQVYIVQFHFVASFTKLKWVQSVVYVCWCFVSSSVVTWCKHRCCYQWHSVWCQARHCWWCMSAAAATCSISS